MREISVDRAWGTAALVTLYSYQKLLPTRNPTSLATPASIAIIAGVFIAPECGVDHHRSLSDMILDSRLGALDRTLGFLSAWPAPPDRRGGGSCSSPGLVPASSAGLGVGAKC